MQNLKIYLFLAPLLIAGFLAWRQLLHPNVRHWANYRMLAMVILPGVGLFAPNIWVYYAALLICMIFVPRSRIEAVGLYVLLALTLPLTNFSVTTGSSLLLHVNAISVMTLGLLASLRFKGDEEKFLWRWTSCDTVLLLMMGLLFAIELRGADLKITNSIRIISSQALLYVIPFLIISRVPVSNIDPRRILHYVGMAGFIVSLEATFEIIQHWPLYDAIDFNLGTRGTGISKSFYQRGGLLRASGPYAESTSFGIVLAFSATIIFAQKSMFRSSLAHAIAVAVCCAGCFSTLGRSGWLSFILGILVVTVHSGRIGTLATFTFAAATAGLGAFLLVADTSLGGNLIGTTGHASSTIDYRERLLTRGLEIFQYSPFIGSNSKFILNEYGSDLVSASLSVDFVNAYLYIALYSGIIGLFIFLAYLLFPAVKIFSAKYNINRNVYIKECANAVFACSIVLAAVMALTSFFERITFMSMLFLAVARQLIIRLMIGGSRTNTPSLKGVAQSAS